MSIEAQLSSISKNISQASFFIILMLTKRKLKMSLAETSLGYLKKATTQLEKLIGETNGRTNIS